LSSTYFERLSVHPQEDFDMKVHGISFVIHISSLVDGRMCLIIILPSARLLVWMHGKKIIKLRVQVFLRMNT